MVTHNGDSHIKGCLESLDADRLRGLEILVVDNASSDTTVAKVRTHGPDVRLVTLDENQGYGRAANLGVGQSNREYVFVLNQDTRTRPGAIEHLVNTLDDRSSAGFVTPKILVLEDPKRINTCGSAVHFTGIATCRGFDRPAASLNKPGSVAAFSGAAFLARRSAFDDLGGFDESFFMYYEDTDLSIRAILVGFEILYDPDAEILHSFEPSFSPEKIFLLERNRYASLFKSLRLRTLTLIFPALVLTELAIWAYCVTRGISTIRQKRQSWSWLLAHAEEINAARSQVQELRQSDDIEFLRNLQPVLDLRELSSPLVEMGVNVLNPLYRLWFRTVLNLVRW